MMFQQQKRCKNAWDDIMHAYCRLILLCFWEIAVKHGAFFFEQGKGLEGSGDCITSHVAGTDLQGDPLASFAQINPNLKKGPPNLHTTP
jgi:hypothetical protein